MLLYWHSDGNQLLPADFLFILTVFYCQVFGQSLNHILVKLEHLFYYVPCQLKQPMVQVSLTQKSMMTTRLCSMTAVSQLISRVHAINFAMMPDKCDA